MLSNYCGLKSYLLLQILHFSLLFWNHAYDFRPNCTERSAIKPLLTSQMVSLFSSITPCYVDSKGRQSLLSVVICNLSMPEARNKMWTKLPTFGYETTGYEMTVVTKWPNTHPSWLKLGLWWLQEQKDQCSIKSYTVIIVNCFERLKRNQLFL